MRSKVIKLVTTLLALLVVVILTGCTGAQPSTQPAQPQKNAVPTIDSKLGAKTQQVGVAPGTTIYSVNGSGNIDVFRAADLTFGTGGKIAKLYVKKGDRVTKGMELAKLETDTLELAVAQAKTALAQAQLAQSQAEVSYKQAEAAVPIARIALGKITDVSDIEDDINDIQVRINVAQERLKEPGTASNSGFWVQEIANLQKDLNQKKKDLAYLLGQEEYAGVLTYDILSQKYDRWVVEDARGKQSQLEAAQLSVTQASNSIEYTRSSVETAKKALGVAQKNLADATIIAPFDGVIATLDVKESDIVPAPAQSQSPVIYLIDPTSMELNIHVSELDVPKVKIGQKAAISLDALTGVKMEGKVTAISPVPSGRSARVDYNVTIDFAVPPAVEVRVGMSASAEIAVE